MAMMTMTHQRLFLLVLLFLHFDFSVLLGPAAEVRVSTGTGSSFLGGSSNASPFNQNDRLMSDQSAPKDGDGLMAKECQDSPSQLKMLATEKGSIILYCEVSPAIAAYDHLIQWKREPDLSPIFARQGVYLPYIHPDYEGRLSIIDDALLKIDPVLPSDEGWYRCEIHFTRQEMCPRTPNRVHLSVKSHPQLIVNDSSPGQVHRPAGSPEVVLRCSFTGTPLPEVTWTKFAWNLGYEVLRPSTRIGISQTSLTIKSFNHNDSGRYQCRAANLVGEATHQISLVADGSVVLIVPPVNVTVDKGDEAVFRCQVDGYPRKISYRWFRDDVEINFPKPVTTILSSENALNKDSSPSAVQSRIDRYTAIQSGQSSILVIKPTTRKDSGRYKCIGSNGEASVETKNAFLSIKFKPKFINMKSFVYLPLGLTVNLTCTAEANPPITKYSWAKGNNYDITDQRFRFSDDMRILNIRNVSRDDAGTYICFVGNNFATDKFEIQVQVTDPPRFLAVPRLLNQAIEGSTVKVDCKAIATIKPTISWMKNGKPLEANERYEVIDGALLIHSVTKSDEGEYVCLAHNVAATVFQSMKLVVEDGNVHAPRNLTVQTGISSATLNWLPAYNGANQRYIVQYRAVATPDLKITSNRPVSPPIWKQMHVKPKGSMTFTIYSLMPNSTYEFRVLARNGLMGEGLYSKVVTMKTKKEDEDADENSSSITADLSSMLSPNYGNEEDDSNLETAAKSMTTANSRLERKSPSPAIDLTRQPGLMLASSTKSMVSDRSVDLVSNYPDALNYKGPKPGAPQNISGTALPGSIILRWLPPDNSTAKQKKPPSYTCYTIEFMAGDEKDWRQLANVSASTESFVLSGPTPNLVYTFRIATCNAKTIGKYSDAVVLTAEGIPSILQVSTETALLGIAGCAVVLIIIISVVVICVRYNRSATPYDRQRQRQCKFVSIDGTGGSPLTSYSPPNKQQPLLLNGNGYLHPNGNGLLKVANGSHRNGNTTANGGNNGPLLLGSASSSNSGGGGGGTATLPIKNDRQWELPPASVPQRQLPAGANQSFIVITDEADGPNCAHCGHCRGGSLRADCNCNSSSRDNIITRRQLTLERQPSGFTKIVFPSQHQRACSSSDNGEEDDDDGDNDDGLSSSVYQNATPTTTTKSKFSNPNNRRPMGRLETLLLMDDDELQIQQQRLVEHSSLKKGGGTKRRHQVIIASGHGSVIDGEYDNISPLCDSGVAVVDGLYVRSRSPLGRYLDGNLNVDGSGAGNNSTTTTTEVGSRSGSIDSSDGHNNAGSIYSNLRGGSGGNSNTSNSPRSPQLSEMTTPPPPPPITMFIAPTSPKYQGQQKASTRAVTFAPSTNFDPQSSPAQLVSETSI